MILQQDHEFGVASQVISIIETKRKDWWPASVAMVVMASGFTFLGIVNREYAAVAIGGLFYLMAIAFLRFDYKVYLDSEVWSYHKRVSTRGLSLKRLDRDLSLYDEHGDCPVKFDRASSQHRGYRLGLIASDQSMIWIDFKGYQERFQHARKACTEAWLGRVSTLDE